MKRLLIGFCSIAIFFMSALFLSCEYNTTVERLQGLEIESQKDIVADDSVFLPISMGLWYWKIVDDKLVMYSSQSDKMCKVFTYPKLAEEFSFAVKGKAADEFISCCWANNKCDNHILLYDIMKSELYSFDISNGRARKDSTLSLMKDQSEMCRSYTHITQLDKDLFLMKEDNPNESNLRLTDMKEGRDLSSYKVSDDKGEFGYPQDDYWYDVLGDKVLLAYRFSDCYDLLVVDNNNIKRIKRYASGSNALVNEDAKVLKTKNVSICSFDNKFYVLLGKDGETIGNEILVFRPDSDKQMKISLNENISNICFDQEGNMLGYKESDGGCMVYIYRDISKL